MNMEEQLRQTVENATADSELWHSIVHGNNKSEVLTENGLVPTVAKQLKDVRDAIMGGVIDVVNVAEKARDDAINAKTQADIIKEQTQDICDIAGGFRDEAESFKNQSISTFNNIATATNAAILSVENSGDAQIVRVQATGTEQVIEVVEAGVQQTSNAKAEADRALYYAQSAAPTPLGSKLTVPACAKVPDGYEPTWYKNTITRARYPDFFQKLVDTGDLFCLDEATYDTQVAEFGMCNGYVKIDDDTLILPLLLNYGRGGTLGQVGQVQKDQFQGHYHSNQIRQDVYGSGDGNTIGPTSGADEGLRFDGPDLFILNPKTGEHGPARFGDETRPKSYFELTYIKCADVVRPLAVEETSEIRNEFVQRTNQVLDYLQGVVQIVAEQRGINGYIKYSDGRMEQWGRAYHNGNSWVTTPFHFEFINDDVCMNITPMTPSNLASGTPSCFLRYDIKRNQFIWHIPSGNGWNCTWRAWGEWK